MVSAQKVLFLVFLPFANSLHQTRMFTVFASFVAFLRHARANTLFQMGSDYPFTNDVPRL